MAVWMQAPVSGLHESAVQILPSSQLIGVFTQPPTGSQLSVVQGLLSSQARGVPDWQPVCGLHVSRPLQTVPSPQESGVPAVHCPLWQISAPLQAF